MELAVNIPEQEPEVGQAFFQEPVHPRSISPAWISHRQLQTNLRASPDAPVMSTPPFMGPPEQNTAGTLVRMAAKIIPGVILSQLGI